MKNTERKEETRPKTGGAHHQTPEEIWSRQTALAGLKRIVEAALACAETEIRDENGMLVEVKFNHQAAGAATKAIEVANRMMGYALPEDGGEAEDTAITVLFGDAEEYAE